MSNPGPGPPSDATPHHQSANAIPPPLHHALSKQLNSSSTARSRVTLVCSECKRLKLRCDRRLPCNQCTKRSTLKRCVYAPGASEKIDVQSLHNRTLMLENWKESTQMLIAALEARLPPLALVPPPPPFLYTAPGMSARPTPLDGFTLAWLAALKVPTTSLRSLESRSPSAMDKFVKLVKSKKVLAEAAGAWDRAFLPPEYPSSTSTAATTGAGLANSINNSVYPFQMPKITSLMLTLLPPATTQSVILLPALQSLLILHPICHFQRFQARCRLLETYQPDGQPWAAQLAARMDQEGPETVYKDEEEPTLAMYAATMAGLAVGALAHRAELRAKGLPIPSSTPGLPHGNGDGDHLHHHPGIAPGNTPGITDADPTKMFAISLRALEKSGYLESTREMEDAQPSLGTDKVLAGLFQVLFLLFCGELEDNAEGVLDGVREERVSELLARIMAGVRVTAGAVGLLSDPDEVTARWGHPGMSLWQKEERRRLAAAVVFYDAIVTEILGEAPTLQDVNYTARPPAEVDDRAFSPDTASVEKVPPVGENAGFCSTFFAMRTRLVRLIKYGDQVVLYARRKDERHRIMSAVESLTTRLTLVQTEEGEEPQHPHLYPYLQPYRHLHAHHQAHVGAAQGSSGSNGQPALDVVAATASLDFDLPTSSSQLVAQHASSQRAVLKDWLAGLPGYMALDESKMFAEEVARTHGGVSAITGEKAAVRNRMSKNGEACVRHPEMIAQQCELVVMVQSAILKWHLPLLKRETKGWEEHDPDWEPGSEAIWTSLEAAKKLVNALNVQQHVIKAKMPLVVSSQVFLRNVFRAGVAFSRLGYLATPVPYRQLDEDDDLLENDDQGVPEWGTSVAQAAREGLAKCVRIYADVEKWMRGIDRKALVVPSFPKSSPLCILEALLLKVESGFVSDLPAAGTKRKRYEFEEAELLAQGLLVPYLESFGGIWVLDPASSDSDETENEGFASSGMEIVGQGGEHPPPIKKFKKAKAKAVVHGGSELVEVTTLEHEQERGRPDPVHRSSMGSVFTVRKREKHSEASLKSARGVMGSQGEGPLHPVKAERSAPIGRQRHHQTFADAQPESVHASEYPTQRPTAYVTPTPQGPQSSVAPGNKYYGHTPSSASLHHDPPKLQPQLRVDTAGLRQVSSSIVPSPVTYHIPHSGISAPSTSAETWTYHPSQFGLPTPQQAQQYETPSHYGTPAAVQTFNSYVQHPGMQSQQPSPDNYPPPPESQMHPHQHTPDHPVAFEDPQYATSVAHATPAVYPGGQTPTGVSPQPAMVYQYPPQPVSAPSIPPQAHRAHAQGSASRGTGYHLGMTGYPTQPPLQSDVQSIPPQMQVYTPTATAQGQWDQSGQDHLAAYSTGFVQSMSTPNAMPVHSGFDQDLQPQQTMDIPFTIPPQPWNPATSDITPSTPYSTAPNAYTNTHSY